MTFFNPFTLCETNMDDNLAHKFNALVARVEDVNMEEKLQKVSALLDEIFAATEAQIKESKSARQLALLELHGNVQRLIRATKHLEQLEHVSKRQRQE